MLRSTCFRCLDERRKELCVSGFFFLSSGVSRIGKQCKSDIFALFFGMRDLCGKNLHGLYVESFQTFCGITTKKAPSRDSASGKGYNMQERKLIQQHLIFTMFLMELTGIEPLTS